VILDTHIFLWWLFDDPRLFQRVRLILGDPGQRTLASSVSVWEIATKFRLGKLPEASEVAVNVSEWIIRAGFEPLSVSPAHAQLAGAWAHAHRDPFDRMLAAQAKIECVPLVTDESVLKTFDIRTVS
jgi:PIN domain nuclease of toxin-antitoxin system